MIICNECLMIFLAWRNRIRRQIYSNRRNKRTMVRAVLVAIRAIHFPCNAFALHHFNSKIGIFYAIRAYKNCKLHIFLLLQTMNGICLKMFASRFAFSDPCHIIALMLTKDSIFPTRTMHSYAKRKTIFKLHVTLKHKVLPPYLYEPKAVSRKLNHFIYTFMALNWKHQHKPYASNRVNRIDRKNPFIQYRKFRMFVRCVWEFLENCLIHPNDETNEFDCIISVLICRVVKWAR